MYRHSLQLHNDSCQTSCLWPLAIASWMMASARHVVDRVRVETTWGLQLWIVNVASTLASSTQNVIEYSAHISTDWNQTSCTALSCYYINHGLQKTHLPLRSGCYLADATAGLATSDVCARGQQQTITLRKASPILYSTLPLWQHNQPASAIYSIFIFKGRPLSPPAQWRLKITLFGTQRLCSGTNFFTLFVLHISQSHHTALLHYHGRPPAMPAVGHSVLLP